MGFASVRVRAHAHANGGPRRWIGAMEGIGEEEGARGGGGHGEGR